MAEENILKRKIFKLIGYLIALASMFFVIRFFIGTEIPWGLLANPITIFLLSLCILLGIVNIFLSAFIWKRILSFIANKNIEYSSVYPVYIQSNLAKYLPGNIMKFVSRNILLKDIGLSQFQIAFSSAIDFGTATFASILLALIIAYQSLIISLQQFIPLSVGNIFLLALFVGLMLFSIAIYTWLSPKNSKYRKAVKKYMSVKFFSLFVSNMLIIISMYAVGNVAFLFALNSIINITFSQATAIIGALLVTGVITVIVPGAPAGIGVREALATFLLFGVVDTSVLPIILVITRLAMVISDVLAYLILTVFSSKKFNEVIWRENK